MSREEDELRRLCARVRRVQLRVRRVVNTRLSGAYASAFPGPGVEFAEFRPYTPGDDVRHIDWPVTSRRRTPYVRRYVEERELRMLVALDVSASMRTGGALSARRRAAVVSAALVLSASRNGDRTGGLLFGKQVERLIRPARGQRHALSVLRHVISHRSRADRTDMRPALRALLDLRRSVVFLLTDFCCAPPLRDPRVRRLLAECARRHELSAVHLLPPVALLKPGGPVVDGLEVESGQPVVVQLPARGKEADRLRAHLQSNRRALRAARVPTAQIGPRDDYAAALLRLLSGRRPRARP